MRFSFDRLIFSFAPKLVVMKDIINQFGSFNETIHGKILESNLLCIANMFECNLACYLFTVKNKKICACHHIDKRVSTVSGCDEVFSLN